MKSVQIYKKILLSRVDFFRKMLQFRPSDIKMAKNMMDGPVFGRFATVFGTVRQQIAQKTVGRCDVHHVGSEGRVFFWGVSGMEISPLAPLGRDDSDRLVRDNGRIPGMSLFHGQSPSFPARLSPSFPS